jgi:hypothetical protein
VGEEQLGIAFGLEELVVALRVENFSLGFEIGDPFLHLLGLEIVIELDGALEVIIGLVEVAFTSRLDGGGFQAVRGSEGRKSRGLSSGGSLGGVWRIGSDSTWGSFARHSQRQADGTPHAEKHSAQHQLH